MEKYEFLIEVSNFLHFGYYTILLLLSWIGCYLIFAFSRVLYQLEEKNRKIKLSVAFGTGFIFWLSQLIAYKTMYQSRTFVIGESVVTFSLTTLSIYLLLNIAENKNVSLKKSYLKGSLIITSGLLLVDYIGFYQIYREHFELNHLLLVLTLLLTGGIIFSAMQFYLHYISEEDQSFTVQWGLFGSFFTALALSGLPFIVILSVIKLQHNLYLDHYKFLFLIPYIGSIIALMMLSLVPTAFNIRNILRKKEKYQSLFSNSVSAIFATDTSGIITEVNETGLFLTGYKKEELLGLHHKQIVIDENPQVSNSFFQKALKGEKNTFELFLKNKNHKPIPTVTSAIPIITDGSVIGIYGISTDMTKMKEAEEKVYRLAYYDDLTHLPNSKYLLEKMKKLKNFDKNYKLTLIEIFQSQKIKDFYNQALFDQVISELVGRINELLSKDCTLYRSDNLQFAIISQNPDQMTELVLKSVERPFIIQNHSIELKLQIGIAEADKTLVPEQVLKHAEVALIKASQSGTNSIMQFEENMMTELKRELYLEQALKVALMNKQLVVYYQPKISINEQEQLNFEALVRWNHPSEGMVSPFVFIPIAEKSGLIYELENYVLRQALYQMKEWLSSGFSVGRMSVNFSQYHLNMDNMVEEILGILDEVQISPLHLDIEITESSIIEDMAKVITHLEKLREIGISISIDDFGTGFSSLSYVQKLPLDNLKIDKSFIQAINANTQSNAIVKTIILMAQNLNLRIIAEGVETRDQLEFLENLDCEEYQGFYFSPPRPPEELDSFLIDKQYSFK